MFILVVKMRIYNVTGTAKFINLKLSGKIEGDVELYQKFCGRQKDVSKDRCFLLFVQNSASNFEKGVIIALWIDDY
jgi:hypothetical protein